MDFNICIALSNITIHHEEGEHLGCEVPPNMAQQRLLHITLHNAHCPLWITHVGLT